MRVDGNILVLAVSLIAGLVLWGFTARNGFHKKAYPKSKGRNSS